MKKVIIAALLCAMMLSVSACSADAKDTPEETQAQTTQAVTDNNSPVVITKDEVLAVISAAKAEYAENDTVSLSDGSTMATEPKDPGLTVQAIEDGSATYDQMAAYATYLVNVRTLVCDRLVTAFPSTNTVLLSKIEEAEDTGDFIFLDPKGAGYDNAASLLSDIVKKDTSDDVIADYVYVGKGAAALYEADSNKSTLLCPNESENAILTAITAKLNPDLLTKEAETTAVTE